MFVQRELSDQVKESPEFIVFQGTAKWVSWWPFSGDGAFEDLQTISIPLVVARLLALKAT